MDQVTLLIIGAGAVFWGLTMIALVDIILKDFKDMKEKVLWLFVASVPLMGWLFYLLFGYRKGTRKKPS